MSRHPQPPVVLVEALLDQAGFGGPWSARALRGVGFLNEHWLLTLSGGEQLVVRRYGWPWDDPPPIDRLAKEVWLHGVLRDAGVPVAPILSSARSEEGDAILMGSLPGKPLGELARRVPPDRLAPAWREAGVGLRRAHDLRPPENVAGRLTGGGVRPFTGGSWAMWVAYLVELHVREAAAAFPTLAIDVGRCRRIVDRAGSLLDARPLRVIHGDAGPWNVLADEQADGTWRCWWLDWEFAQAGDPTWDLMRATLDHHHDIGGLPAAFLDGYGAPPWEPAFSIYALQFHLWMCTDQASRRWGMATVAAAERYLAHFPTHLDRIEHLVDHALYT